MQLFQLIIITSKSIGPISKHALTDKSGISALAMSPTVSDASFTAEIMQVPALAYMDEEQQRQSQMGDGYPEYSGNQQSLHSHRVTSLKSQEPSSSTLDASSVTSAVASEAMKKFLVDNIAKEGFESAEPAALYRFEQEIVACESYSNRPVVAL